MTPNNTKLVERLTESVVIGFHSDGYACVGSDGHYEGRSPTPMTRLANRDGPEAAALIKELVEALELFVSEYVEMVESGDAGFWDAEQEAKVIKARAALERARA